MDVKAPSLGDRSLFPGLRARAYLNHAAISPPSHPVREAVNAVLMDFSRRGAEAYGDSYAEIESLRKRLAELLGARREGIALVPNTTAGVTDIALCFPWSRGDRIIVFSGEFPANVTPWQRAAELFGLELGLLPLDDYAAGDELGLARLRSELERGARLLAVSAVQFQTGLRMPLAAIGKLCREHDCQVFVDGIQACGSVPLALDELGVDYLSCGGHKWMMGIPGAGFLYVRPERARELRPHVAGWLSHEDPLEFLVLGGGHLRYDRPIRPEASFVEGGGQSLAGYAALLASVQVLLSLGVEAIHAHANAYLDVLEPGMIDRGFVSLRRPDRDGRSCILGLVPPDGIDLKRLHAELGARSVACAMPDGVLRMSPHWPNDPGEVEDVLAAVDQAVAAARA